MAQLTFKLLLQALDKGSGPTRTFTGAVKALNAESRKGAAGWIATANATDKAERSTRRYTSAAAPARKSIEEIAEAQDRLRRSSDRAEGSLARFFRNLGRHSRNAAGGFGRGVGWLGRGLGGLAAGGAGMAAQAGAWAGAAAGGGAVVFGRGVIGTGAQFEGYQTVLTTIEGSASKARESMQWVTKFASTTPYEIDQVMESFVRLKAYGIDPTDGALRTLGDTSSAMNKDIMAAVEMLADAQTGEFERLKEFGVRAKQQGDKVTFTYSKAGKDITVTSKKTASEIRRNLLGILDSRFAGAMAAQSKTFDGMLSNLKDRWTAFKLGVSDEGVFDFAKEELGALLAFLDEAAKDGRLKAWTKEVGGNLKTMLENLSRFAKEVDWVGLTNGAIGLANAIAKVATAMVRIEEARARHRENDNLNQRFWNPFWHVATGLGSATAAFNDSGPARPRMNTTTVSRSQPPAKVDVRISVDAEGRAKVKATSDSPNAMVANGAWRGMIYGSD